MTRPAGVLLTGGESTRLGRDKARLTLAGETLAARAARVLAATCNEVIEVGPGVSGVPATQEQPPGGGPLAGLLAGADALEPPAGVLLLAVDLPMVDVPLLHLVGAYPGEGVVVPVAGGVRQWTCARYEPSALLVARALFDRGERSLRALADVVPVTELTEPEWAAVAPPGAFLDLDTETDARMLGIDLPTRS